MVTETPTAGLVPDQMPGGYMVEVLLKDLPDDFTGPAPTKEFIASVKRFGVLFPIGIVDKPEGWQVVAGRRRIRAAREVGITKVWAKVIEGDTPSSVYDILGQAQKTNEAVEYDAITAMLDHGATMDEITEVTTLPIGRIRRLLRLDDLKPELLTAFRQGKISTSVAYSVSRLSYDEQQDMLDKFEAEGKLTTKQVKAVKKVQLDDAIAALPGDLFGDIGDFYVEAERITAVREMTMVMLSSFSTVNPELVETMHGDFPEVDYNGSPKPLYEYAARVAGEIAEWLRLEGNKHD